MSESGDLALALIVADMEAIISREIIKPMVKWSVWHSILWEHRN